MVLLSLLLHCLRSLSIRLCIYNFFCGIKLVIEIGVICLKFFSRKFVEIFLDRCFLQLLLPDDPFPAIFKHPNAFHKGLIEIEFARCRVTCGQVG